MLSACSVLALTDNDFLVVEPDTGKVTSRQRILDLVKVSWDRRTDELFRLVVKNDQTNQEHVVRTGF